MAIFAAPRSYAGGGRVVAIVTVLVASLVIGTAAADAAVRTKRVSIASSGAEGVGGSSDSAEISASGRFITFESGATGLVLNDSNDRTDIFVRDQKAKKTKRVSVRGKNKQANEDSYAPSISGNGRFVSFHSDADNLVKGDDNGTRDVFVRDRVSRKTFRISQKPNGKGGNGLSFHSAISANGRFVAFVSQAENLVKRDSNGIQDVFVHDRKTGRNSLVSVRSNGRQANHQSRGPSISANGRYVAFESFAGNLVKNDDNGKLDAFVHDRKTGKTRRVSVKSNGKETAEGGGNAQISGDGRFVVFISQGAFAAGEAPGHADVFIHDVVRRKTRLVNRNSAGDAPIGGPSQAGVPSHNGRYVVFDSGASNLVSDDLNGQIDVFRRDRKEGKTKRVSTADGGGQSLGHGSRGPDITPDGRFAVFASAGPGFVDGDDNDRTDVFRRGPLK